ncbi:hypothetical protein AAY473_016990 [Plecturocebus cupreus]
MKVNQNTIAEPVFLSLMRGGPLRNSVLFGRAPVVINKNSSWPRAFQQIFSRVGRQRCIKPTYNSCPAEGALHYVAPESPIHNLGSRSEARAGQSEGGTSLAAALATPHCGGQNSTRDHWFAQGNGSSLKRWQKKSIKASFPVRACLRPESGYFSVSCSSLSVAWRSLRSFQNMLEAALQRSFYLSLLSSWDYKGVPPCLASFCSFCREQDFVMLPRLFLNSRTQLKKNDFLTDSAKSVSPH